MIWSQLLLLFVILFIHYSNIASIQLFCTVCWFALGMTYTLQNSQLLTALLLNIVYIPNFIQADKGQKSFSNGSEGLYKMSIIRSLCI